MLMTQRLLGTPNGLSLVGPGFLSSPLNLTRAQLAGVQSSAINGTNDGLTFYGADVPRFNGSAQRLLIEGQRTNLINGMAAPVTQNVTVTAAAHTLTLYGTGSITLSGVATGTLNGTGANDRVALTFTPTAGTLTLTVSGTVTRAQLELGGFATSYIEVSSGAATRGADVVSASLSSLGINAASECTVLWSGLINNREIGTGSTIIHISDNTSSNRFFLQNAFADGALYLRRSLAGVGSDALLGNFTPGSLFKVGCSISSGRMAGSLNGGAVAAATGGPISGLLTFNYGTNNTGISPMNGETAILRVLPYPVSDSELQSLVSALP